jgi:hypothetical protein
MLQMGWEVFKRKVLDGESNFGVINDKDKTGRVTCTRSLGVVVSSSESIKDRTDVGLLTEDPLTGHMPRHG